MAYFANGTEGIAYMERWCSRCLNCGDDKYEFGCAVWDLHSLFQSERDFSQTDGGVAGRLLDALIPRTEDGLNNGRCLMFREQDAIPQGMSLLEWFDSVHGAPNA